MVGAKHPCNEAETSSDARTFMNLTYVLLQNLKRNRLRTALTAIAFALPMAVFVAALSLVVVMMGISKNNEKQLRLGVRNRISLINLMPEAMRRRIEALDPNKERITAVCGMRWFGGRVPGTQASLTNLAADPDTFPLVYPDIGLTQADYDAWLKERTAAVIGQSAAEQYKWKVGDRVTLESTVPPYLSLEFKVVAIMQSSMRSNVFYIRRDYLDESLKAAGEAYGRCNVFWMKTTSVDAMRSLQKEIDEMTANSPDATRSDDENAFLAGFIQGAGDIPGLMRAMAMVVVFIVALVAGNTMMLNFRERTRELGVFKAMGFQSSRVMWLIVGESVLIALIGALLGVIPISLLLYFFPPRNLGIGPIGAIEVSPTAIGLSVVIALAVGLAAGLWPGVQAMRLRTVDALRKVA